ncbi:hypothetical protein ASG87_17185 [Frateuria sp. Soil773]|uniref:DUF2147 domain-containing protein n=1 Tax=Frateuria sp. Soil773 TaxID=1736407 RepID=UPI0006FFD848|nr:DUF2147 domain-containing protein [Frateuria sp. Soil773]KRE95009.1 hypothetical protein ASG87_17185 [Frateuria sp. Soil773]
MKRTKRLPGLLAMATALLSCSGLAWAASDTPAGSWKVIDGDTGNATAIVQLSEVDGELRGMVSRVLQSGGGAHPVCAKCRGKLQDQPIEGMVFLWNLRKDDKNDKEWTGGKLLDTDNGKVYKAKLELSDGGRKLELRRYSGLSMLGHSQEWQRTP